ncbi:Transcriptional regulatory protein LnrK [Paenibacillus plantiphilus]|uniref:Transcriptional regulatory protein LnrK n=1 Tax=Paenibacillus plantiphilus TaxID=2905650 RepID=A0ABN8GIV4_9BACL|nr:response regulator transcription factor [Paenibacillus plantiphilus]CAH1210124.1 Transcriptional regulatory protein LnrK [Paenibacillus plantiphilus]
MIRILIADDDPYIRESLQVLLGLDPELDVVGTCGDGEAAYQFVQGHTVDIVLMDIRMPDCNGVEGTKKLKSLPNPPAVLILTTFDDDEYIIEALRSGANGYLLKNVPPSRIISGIKTVNDGSMLVHPDIARKLAGLVSSGPQPADLTSSEAEERRRLLLTGQGLTQAEWHVVQLIADGKSNKEIASALFLSEGTIKNYISAILDKLSLRDRTQLAIYYLKM